jgi:hypothetical protein
MGIWPSGEHPVWVVDTPNPNTGPGGTGGVKKCTAVEEVGACGNHGQRAEPPRQLEDDNGDAELGCSSRKSSGESEAGSMVWSESEYTVKSITSFKERTQWFIRPRSRGGVAHTNSSL